MRGANQGRSAFPTLFFAPRNAAIASRSLATSLLAVLAVSQPVFALLVPLTDSAVREAYFLGQRNDQKTSDLLKQYTGSLPLPDTGPYVSEIHLLTPYAQVVSNSALHTNGYSAQQAVADYHGRGDTILLQVRIEFTVTYNYQDAVRTANDAAGELNRELHPEDFWRGFLFDAFQNDKPLEPSSAYANPIYASSSQADSTATLRGAVVWIEYDANLFQSQPVEIQVTTPAGAKVKAGFDLEKLR